MKKNNRAELLEKESNRAAGSEPTLGTVELYARSGERKLVPVPTSNPNDPLNLPAWRKWLMILSICLLISIGMSVQDSLMSLMPVLTLEYNGEDPKMLNSESMGPLPIPKPGPYGHISANIDDMPSKPGAPSAQAISMLGSLPSLMVGISGFISVPLSETLGRRPVMLMLAIMAWFPLLWAGRSTSLSSHIGARCIQAFGTGAFESLLPLVLQDVSFIHERNRFMSTVWAVMSIITTCLDIASTHIVANLGWRSLYFIMAGPAGLACLLIYLFMPETRVVRTAAELAGDTSHLSEGQIRPDIDVATYGKLKSFDPRIVQQQLDLRACVKSTKQIATTILFPNVVWVVLINSLAMAIFAAGQMTNAAVFLRPPFSWPEKMLGMTAISSLLAAILGVIINGIGGDYLALLITKANKGIREPEHQLVNYILPISVMATGSALFGYIAENPMGKTWPSFYATLVMIAYGLMSINTVSAVYAVECYPKWAGAVLVMVSSMRDIISFGLSFGVYTFIDYIGYQLLFSIFAVLIGGIGLFGIAVYIWGKQIRSFARRWTNH